MTLRPRHQWCLQRVSDAFSIDRSVVDKFARDGSNYEMLDDFLSGRGPEKLMCFYQPLDRQTESGEWIAGDGAAQLFLTFGDREKLRGKAVYFIRNLTDPSKGVDLDKVCTHCVGPRSADIKQASDSSVLVGEVTSDPLRLLESQVSGVYKPSFENRTDWGKADDDQSHEFKSEVSKFVDGLADTLRSLGGGIELAKPDSKYDLEAISQGRNREDPELVRHFEGAQLRCSCRCAC